MVPPDPAGANDRAASLKKKGTLTLHGLSAHAPAHGSFGDGGGGSDVQLSRGLPPVGSHCAAQHCALATPTERPSFRYQKKKKGGGLGA